MLAYILKLVNVYPSGLDFSGFWYLLYLNNVKLWTSVVFPRFVVWTKWIFDRYGLFHTSFYFLAVTCFLKKKKSSSKRLFGCFVNHRRSLMNQGFLGVGLFVFLYIENKNSKTLHYTEHYQSPSNRWFDNCVKCMSSGNQDFSRKKKCFDPLYSPIVTEEYVWNIFIRAW